MAEPIARVENIGKQFSLTPVNNGEFGVRDVLRRIAGRPTRTNRHREAFWAVRNVSFEAFPGETIGIIGLNGSGKTTLLRLVAGMIKPDQGFAQCRGHLQAIINLNAGFKPQLSGLENVKTALSLRGVSGKRARQRLEEIIEFSGVSDFIDHPIIHYSSGMVARLAFSTCIFLDPDLLLVDEALSVGDRSFKNKCLLKMAELKARGVSMLFVSHSMGEIQHFCERTLWMNRGVVRAFGESKTIIEQYVEWIDQQSVDEKKAEVARTPVKADENNRDDPLHGEFHHVKDMIDIPVCRINRAQDELVVIKPHDTLSVEYSFRLHQPIQDTTIVIKIHRYDGLLLARLSSRDDGNDDLGTIGPGLVEGRMELADVNLAPGAYVLLAEIVTGSRAFLYRGVIGEFHVKQVTCYFNGLIGMRRRHTIRVVNDAASTQPQRDRVEVT